MKMNQTMLLLCGWVLWSQYLPVDQYKTIAAYETKAECMKERDDWEKNLPSPRTPILYTCLPDTVDPRVVKGK